jgi:hypothetical protein
MQTRQGYTLEALRAVQQFLADHAAQLPTVVATGASRRLDELIGRLAEHATEQVANTIEGRMATQAYHTLRRALVREHMAAIIAVARLEAPTITAVQPLRLPHGNVATARLAAEAFGLAQVVEPYSALFVAAGLPEGFVEELREAAQAMATARNEHQGRRGRVVGATTGIRTSLTTGRRLVAVLDVLVRRTARDDQALLTEWETVKHVHRIGRRGAALVLAPPANVPALASPEAPRMLPAGVSAEGERVET